LRILIIIAACVALYFILRHLFRQNPQNFTRYFFLAFIGLFILTLLALAITGRLHWLFALLAGLLPWARRLLPILRLAPLLRVLRSVGGMRSMGAGSSAGHSSSVNSYFFKMVLNHDSGEIGGEVVKGEFKGRLLRQLSVHQLKRLLHECQADDDSYALFGSYLSYRFGSDWQSQFDVENQGDKTSNKSAEKAMSSNEALDILDLVEPVTKADIIKAHRSMMQKFHPDRGGSNYLAAKINEAKECLLQRVED